MNRTRFLLPRQLDHQQPALALASLLSPLAVYGGGCGAFAAPPPSLPLTAVTSLSTTGSADGSAASLHQPVVISASHPRRLDKS